MPGPVFAGSQGKAWVRTALAAACILFAFTLGTLLPHVRPVTPPSDATTVKTAGMLPPLRMAAVERDRRFFADVEADFKNHLPWLAITGDQYEMGPLRASSPDSALWALEVTLAQPAANGEKPPATVSTRWLIVPGEQASIAVPLPDGGSARYNLVAGRPGRPAVEIGVEHKNRFGDTVALLASQVVLPVDGKPVKAGEWHSRESGWQLWVAGRAVRDVSLSEASAQL